MGSLQDDEVPHAIGRLGGPLRPHGGGWPGSTGTVPLLADCRKALQCAQRCRLLADCRNALHRFQARPGPLADCSDRLQQHLCKVLLQSASDRHTHAAAVLGSSLSTSCPDHPPQAHARRDAAQVDGGRVLREARQSAGLSQRAVALRAGVAMRTVAGIESREHRPSLPVLEAVLAACELQLTTEVRVSAAEPCRHLRAHLSLSLTQRLVAAAGSTGSADAVLDSLRVAARVGVAVLEPVVAAALWVPGLTWPMPVVVTVFPEHEGWPLRPLRGAPPPEVLVVRRPTAHAPTGLVKVRLPASALDVQVHHPAALAGAVDCVGLRGALGAASRLLDEERGTDAAGRRPPAHRQPDEDDEAWRLSHALRYVGRKRPSALDSRAFRLRAPVSLPQWLSDNRLPPLRGQRERW